MVKPEYILMKARSNVKKGKLLIFDSTKIVSESEAPK
jgi:hypothetical protein